MGCGTSGDDEKLILKGIPVLQNLQYTDPDELPGQAGVSITPIPAKKIKSYSQYGFLIEDVDDLAKRNEMPRKWMTNPTEERTDQTTMTLVSIFQYMIGNTDWSVPPLPQYQTDAGKLIPFLSMPSPYDFDFCGLVNAEYARQTNNWRSKP